MRLGKFREGRAWRRRSSDVWGALTRLGLGVLTLLCLVHVLATGVWASRPSSYREGRYATVVGQTSWYTCGPAAVATILHHFYDMDVGEADVLARAIGAVATMRSPGQDATRGVSALALVQALESYGVKTVGYRLSVEAVADFFRRGGMPVIVHVTEPEHHYVVAVGMVGDWMLIADPSWGRRVERWLDFAGDKRFSGVTLVPIPPADKLSTVAARQAEALRWMDEQLVRLASAGRRYR